MHIVDRRLNPGGKSLENRQRFLRRAKVQVQRAVRDAVRDRGIRDIDAGDLHTCAVTTTNQAPSVPQQALAPAVDIAETDSGITLLADMPGVSKDRLTIQVEGDNLTIEGRAQIDVPDSIELLHSEVRTPYFRRSFGLPTVRKSYQKASLLGSGGGCSLLTPVHLHRGQDDGLRCHR